MAAGNRLEEERREDRERDGGSEREQVGRRPVVRAVGLDVRGEDGVEDRHGEEHAGAAGERHHQSLRLVAQLGQRHLRAKKMGKLQTS